jgi:hypothetical protein
MDQTHRAILASLPPPRRRSKLDPHWALIRALRAHGRSYRQIVAILRDRCGLHVAVHTLHHFVRRAQQTASARRPRYPVSPVRRPRSGADPSSLPPRSDADDDVSARIAAIKRRAPALAAEPKAFAYDENEPLQLIADVKLRRR